MCRCVRPRVEQLEDRCTPATFGNPWPLPEFLEISFAPDGTSVGKQQSDLFAALDAQFGDSQTWQREILRAFQTWSADSAISFFLRSDNGAPFGLSGLPQGADSHGDIRIAGIAASPDIVCFAVPYDVSAGNWSGDVFINTNHKFSLDGANGTYDLFAVMLHEAAHVLGIPHSHDPASSVYGDYHGVVDHLTAKDIAAVQSIYGARVPDNHEGLNGNDSLALANPLAPSNDYGYDAAISSYDDLDRYQFTADPADDRYLIDLYVGLLASRVSLLDASGNVLQTVEDLDPLNNYLSIRLDKPTPGATYFVQVEAATSDVFGVGGYYLAVHPYGADHPGVPYVPPAPGTRLDDNFFAGLFLAYGGNTPGESPETALNLTFPHQQVYANNELFLFTSALYPASDDAPGNEVDWYSIEVPADASPSNGVMTVAAFASAPGQLAPRIEISRADATGADRTVVPVSPDLDAVQVAHVQAGERYYVRVFTDEHAGGQDYGGYLFAIDFSSKAAELEVIATGHLTSTQATRSVTLDSKRTEIAHLGLIVEGATNDVNVWLRILAPDGQVVAEQLAPARSVLSLTTLLAPGHYRVAISLDGPAGSGPLRFTLLQDVLDDPIGPHPADVTLTPQPPVALSLALSSKTLQPSRPQLQDPVDAPYWMGTHRPKTAATDDRPNSGTQADASTNSIGGSDGVEPSSGIQAATEKALSAVVSEQSSSTASAGASAATATQRPSSSADRVAGTVPLIAGYPPADVDGRADSTVKQLHAAASGGLVHAGDWLYAAATAAAASTAGVLMLFLRKSGSVLRPARARTLVTGFVTADNLKQ